ncbi:MAG: hypothetical protein DMG57_22785 [Acidobacteria bacterium]|nr:MAG: hypothetical protein DMG57_22785 [Acidobacteriota bacterium]
MRLSVYAVLLACLLAAAVETRNEIPFSTVGGETLLIDAHIPEGAGLFPAIILVLGGGWSKGTKQAAPRGSEPPSRLWESPRADIWLRW